MMNKENPMQFSGLSRRQFLKQSLALSTISAVGLSFHRLLFSQPNTTPPQIIADFIDPYGVCVAPNGLIYVTDAGGYCIKVFDLSGKLVKKMGEPGSSGSQLNYPQGISVDANGNLYVIDSNNGRIAIFNADGKLESSIGSVGGYPEAFYTPKGIFVGDKIYACNTRNHVLSVFDKATHELIGSYGDLGDDPPNLSSGSRDYRFRLPTDVAVSEDGKIYVVDSKHSEIKVLAKDGGFLFKFGGIGSAEGQMNLPEGMALDHHGNVYVCDALNGRLQRFDSQGKFLGSLNQGFKRPTSIHIDNSNKFYVVDSELKQVIIFEWTA